MPTDAMHLVTRTPGAPPRRAGRVWAAGETRCTLTAAEAAAVAADPGYRLALIQPTYPVAAPAPEAPEETGRTEARPRTGRRRARADA